MDIARRPFLLCFGPKLGHDSSCPEDEKDEEDERELGAEAPGESLIRAWSDMAILWAFHLQAVFLNTTDLSPICELSEEARFCSPLGTLNPLIGYVLNQSANAYLLPACRPPEWKPFVSTPLLHVKSSKAALRRVTRAQAAGNPATWIL